MVVGWREGERARENGRNSECECGTHRGSRGSHRGSRGATARVRRKRPCAGVLRATVGVPRGRSPCVKSRYARSTATANESCRPDRQENTPAAHSASLHVTTASSSPLPHHSPPLHSHHSTATTPHPPGSPTQPYHLSSPSPALSHSPMPYVACRAARHPTNTGAISLSKLLKQVILEPQGTSGKQNVPRHLHPLRHLAVTASLHPRITPTWPVTATGHRPRHRPTLAPRSHHCSGTVVVATRHDAGHRLTAARPFQVALLTPSLTGALSYGHPKPFSKHHSCPLHA